MAGVVIVGAGAGVTVAGAIAGAGRDDQLTAALDAWDHEVLFTEAGTRPVR